MACVFINISREDGVVCANHFNCSCFCLCQVSRAEIVDVIFGKRGLESDVNLLIKQQQNFDKEQKFQGDKGYQGAEMTMTPKKSRENKKCHQK